MLYQDLTIREPRTTTCVTKDIQYVLHSPQNNNALSSNLFIKKIDRQPGGGKHRSLRLNLAGTLVHEANRCLLIGTLICGGMIGFPFLFMLADCWKHKVFRLVQIDQQIYQAIAKLIETEEAEEVYLTLEDNFFSASKANLLLAGMRNVKNFRFVNTAKGFNTIGHNYTDFRNYMPMGILIDLQQFGVTYMLLDNIGMSFYRSEPVSYFSVIIPRENVWSVLHAIAETELIHLNPCSTAVSNKAFIFRLRTCEEALQKVTHLRTLLPANHSYKLDPLELMTASRQLIKEKNEESMLNELHEIVATAWQEHQLRKKRIEQLMEDQSEIENRTAVLDVGGSLFGYSLFEQTSHYKCGVLPTKDIAQFERIVFRMTKGMSFIKVISFVNGKSIFFIFYNRGERDYLGTKLAKLIQTHSQEFCFPANPQELQKLKVGLDEQRQQNKKLIKLCREEEEQAMQKLMEAVSENSQMSKIEFYYWHILKERQICRQLVCMKQHGHFFETTAFILTADIETAINLHTSADSPSPQFTPIYHSNKPTQLASNSFTTSSLQILLAYGVPSYQQVNPAFFNLITFPFLFGVMFGDMGHGLILFIFALTLFLWPKKYPQIITKSLLPHAQMLILMGFFAFYCGLIYNEFFSMSLNLFGSCYPEAQLVQGCVYPVGIDPIWNISVNSLNFTNSLKMKIAVIIGVVHMTLGLCIKASNTIFFRRWIELMFQFVPQLFFFVCLFGYMDFLIIYKWLTSWPQNEAPSIITIMINIPLRLGRTEQCCGGQPMWGTFQDTSQDSIQLGLLIIALISVPLMLLVKPIYIQFKQNKEARLHEQSDRLQVRGAFLEEEEGFQKVNKGELWVHQLILTIEYVLGSISNTASYLRLWALSLAHSQLSDVFFAKTIQFGLEKGYAGIGLNLLLFPAFAALTFGILMCMDSMECFLHTLRLHWVQFQNKFFHGEGFLFQPFKFIGKEAQFLRHNSG